MRKGRIGVVWELVTGVELSFLHPKAFPVDGDPKLDLMEHLIPALLMVTECSADPSSSSMSLNSL